MMVVYEQIIGSWFHFSVTYSDWTMIAFPRATSMWLVPGTEEDGHYWRNQ